MSEDTSLQIRSIPPEVARRLGTWRTLYLTHLTAHYFLGICGVIASALAGFKLPEPYQQCCAGFATICIAIVGFVRPDRKYQKFVQAWRKLEICATRYRYRQCELSDLLSALNEGEQLIGDFDRVIDSGAPPTRSKAGPPSSRGENKEKFESKGAHRERDGSPPSSHPQAAESDASG